ncbi:hypothetical protein THARTR1_05585 [Trichoderma harzianum]|uniref:Uncharacterized protein n=1 Tax=Trichoderma harzianum TaxID=5544 RepID=A0A2K0U9E1_TRIHA|nr:hypothetical protein THARTR1_05585 [Trichoderma harzianum]
MEAPVEKTVEKTTKPLGMRKNGTRIPAWRITTTGSYLY